MILSTAHAPVDDPTAKHILGAWSDIVVGQRPGGLIDCYLCQGDGLLQMVSIWESLEHHDRALEEKRNHPALGFFEACGVDPDHHVQHVIGHLPHS